MIGAGLQWEYLAVLACLAAVYMAVRLALDRAKAGAERSVLASEAEAEALGSALATRGLPWSWQWLWPLVHRVHPLFARRVSRALHGRLAGQVASAGLPASVTPAHIVAWQMILLTGVCATTVGCVVVGVWAQGVAEWTSGHSGAGMSTVVGAAACCGMAALAGLVWPMWWLKRRARARRQQIDRQIPFFLDIVVLCVQGGLNIHGALTEAVRHGPRGALADEIGRVLSEVRAGQTRHAAFAAFAERADSIAVHRWLGAMAQAETFGASLAPLLQAQADEQRRARFEQAERLALQAPVKLLLPLVVFIFPCTFIVIGFPIAVSMGLV